MPTDAWTRIKNKVRPVVLARDSYLCQIRRDTCENPLGPLPPSRLEVDHIQPLSLGGELADLSNLQTVCKTCHRWKTNIQTGYALPGHKPARRPKQPPTITELELTREY